MSSTGGCWDSQNSHIPSIVVLRFCYSPTVLCKLRSILNTSRSIQGCTWLYISRPPMFQAKRETRETIHSQMAHLLFSPLVITDYSIHGVFSKSAIQPLYFLVVRYRRPCKSMNSTSQKNELNVVFQNGIISKTVSFCVTVTTVLARQTSAKLFPVLPPLRQNFATNLERSQRPSILEEAIMSFNPTFYLRLPMLE